MFYDFDDLFNSFFSGFGIAPQQQQTTQKQCPLCRRTWQEFSSSGKAGCPKCYDTFRPQIRVSLAQINPSAQHKGKIPANSGKDMARKRHYESLKEQLKKAVEAEDYESAAKLHKEIKQIESEGRGERK